MAWVGRDLKDGLVSSFTPVVFSHLLSGDGSGASLILAHLSSELKNVFFFAVLSDSSC